MAGFLEWTVLRWTWQNKFRRFRLLYACPIVLNCETFLPAKPMLSWQGKSWAQNYGDSKPRDPATQLTINTHGGWPREMLIKPMQTDRPLLAFNRRILPQILATFLCTIGCRNPGKEMS